MKFPPSLQKLMDYLSHFPSVGPKTAERYVFHLLKKNPEYLQELAQAIAELKEKIQTCSHCHTISESNPCHICANPNRKQNIICVVGEARDMLAIEATGTFDGLYHVLGGNIDAINNVKPENLNIKTLLIKIKKLQTQELILALNPTLEGETTAMYLHKILKPANIKITRIARGLPMGSDIEYADDITISNAFKYRNVL